jgi:hypothetical protein
MSERDLHKKHAHTEQGDQEPDATQPTNRQLRALSQRSDAAVALNRVSRFGHRELIGQTLHATRLSPSEAGELRTLVSKRQDGELEQDEERRYEQLVGQAAGDEGLFDRKRAEEKVHEKVAEYRVEERLDSLPRRAALAEAGSVTLPREVFDALRGAEPGAWTVADIGMLALVWLMFENRDSVIPGASFVEEEGEAVLVCSAELQDLRLPAGVNPHWNQDHEASGSVRVGLALANLAHKGWLTIEQRGTERWVRLGLRAKR